MIGAVFFVAALFAVAGVVAWAGAAGRHHPACKPERKDER